jgi:hypothetical protein
VDRRAVAGAVVAHHALDAAAVTAIERDRAVQEADGRRCLLVRQDFDVGQARGVIDTDMHELPADDLLAVLARAALQATLTVDAVPGPAAGDAPDGDVLDAGQRAAFERYIRGGGGFAWVHATTDSERSSPFFSELVGARFASHPAIQQATVLVPDRVHPSTRSLPERWTRTESGTASTSTRGATCTCSPRSTSARTTPARA